MNRESFFENIRSSLDGRLVIDHCLMGLWDYGEMKYEGLGTHIGAGLVQIFVSRVSLRILVM